MILFSNCEVERWPMGRDKTGRWAFMAPASERRWVAYSEGRVPSANTSSSQASSLAIAARRAANQLRGWNQ